MKAESDKPLVFVTPVYYTARRDQGLSSDRRRVHLSFVYLFVFLKPSSDDVVIGVDDQRTKHKASSCSIEIMGNLHRGGETDSTTSLLFTDFRDPQQIDSWRRMTQAIVSRYAARYGDDQLARWRFET